MEVGVRMFKKKSKVRERIFDADDITGINTFLNVTGGHICIPWTKLEILDKNNLILIRYEVQ